jgi:tetratricopeptide (TPR) repeat protein
MPDLASLAEALGSIRESMRRLDFLSAYDQASHAQQTWPDDLQLDYDAIFALANLGALSGATQRLNRLDPDRIDTAGPDLAQDLRTLRGRLLKDQALRQHGAGRQRLARDAAAAYVDADARSGGRSYPAINAASLSALAGDLAAAKDHATRALERARAEPPNVWTMFTEAEALLILGDIDAAEGAYAKGATAAGNDMRAIGSARRQLQWLVPALGPTPAAVRGPAPPMILYWVVDASAFSDAASALVAALDERDVNRHQSLAIGPILSAADIAIAHRLQQDGVRVQLVLPCGLAACRDALTPGVDAALFDATVGAAATIAYVTAEGRPDETALAILARQQARGTALLRGAGLAAPVWRAGCVGGQMALSLDDERDESALPAGQRAPTATPGERVWRALLFGDVNGFSRLDEAGQLLFIEHIIGGFADALDAHGPSVDYVETAGDGIYIVLGSVREAAACSIAMHEVLSPARLQSVGLPGHLKLRISAHAGPVRRMFDRVIRRHRYCGTEVIRTARIEPVTPPGETYVTEQLAAALASSSGAHWRCDYVGIQPMAKGYGSCRMYSLQPAASF